MGAGASTISFEHCSAEDVGNMVASVGEKYVPYKTLILENGISGDVLSGMDDVQIKECLQSVGITNTLHQNVLLAKLKKAIGSPQQQAGGATNAMPVSSCKFHPLPPNFEIQEKVTKTPKSVMSQLFEIQGIAVDPTDLDPAVDKIAKAVGGGFGDGQFKYDCFINYRVAADADLAEKLYLYLRTKGIFAFLDKKCLKNGEKWKDGFLTGLKNSKCFVSLISRKALERVRDKTGDHTYDNVLLEYETALNIMAATQNPQFICPLHVGECIGGTLTKFQDFGSSLYPDSIVPIPGSANPPTANQTAAKPPKVPEKKSNEETDEEQEEQEQEQEQEQEEEQEQEQEEQEEEEEEGEVLPEYDESLANKFVQPAGTKSVYNESYYCEIKNVELKPDENLLIVEYNVRGDMSLGGLQDPSSSQLCFAENIYQPSDKKVFFADDYQNRGELVFSIPTSCWTDLLQNKVTFLFGEGGYSEAMLVLPGSEYQEIDLPKCSPGTHYMVVSDYAEGNYAFGYCCDICGQHGFGLRWLCQECTSDKCFSCEPLRVFYPKTAEGSDMERCSGWKYSIRFCDSCSRAQLQCDPEYYHCGGEEYDLCLCCSSQQMLDKMGEEE